MGLYEFCVPCYESSKFVSLSVFLRKGLKDFGYYYHLKNYYSQVVIYLTATKGWT
jgi:hypothetical protein